jgi:hypothetical protein
MCRGGEIGVTRPQIRPRGLTFLPLDRPSYVWKELPMPKTIRTAAILLIVMAIAGCRIYDHARRAAVHAMVTRGVGALQPLAQSSYRPAPLHETITVTAKAPEVAEIAPDPEPEALPVARSLASLGNAPGVRLCTQPLPPVRFARVKLPTPKEVVRCRVTIEGAKVIVVETSSL